MAKLSDVAVCPHCGKELEDGAPYSDFFVAGQFAQETQAVKDECGWCDHKYTLTKSGDIVTAEAK